MIEFLSSRSRAETSLRCPRARWWMHEAQGCGYEPVKRAVPLVTGGAVHLGLAAMLYDDLRGQAINIDQAVDVALMEYDKACQDRGFQLGDLEDQSFVYQEQRALTEALVRLAGLRMIPRLLGTYEVLEVETMDKVTLHTTGDVCKCGHQPGHHSANQLMCRECNCEWYEPAPGWTITWRSIPDALLRNHETHELFVLSWKTIGEYSAKTDEAARVDMQGVSEMWTKMRTMQTYADQTAECIPSWYYQQGAEGWPLTIRGVQMVYLVKGQRRRASKDMTTAVQAESGNGQAEVWKTASALIYGYQDKSFPPKLAWSAEWRCSGPHPMRRSQWYPAGECPGDGRLHRRGDDWSSFPVWHAMGVKAWMAELDQGKITPEAGDPLESSWAMPVPYFRPQGQVESWLRQTRASERRTAEALIQIREYEADKADKADNMGLEVTQLLDENFPQHTALCEDWFHRRCPCWELCHGPEHIRRDPVASGVYQVKAAYQEKTDG